MDLLKISNGKYKCKNKIIEGGAFSKIYDVESKAKPVNKKNKYIAKLHQNKYKKEAINEIEILLKLKKNKKKFKSELQKVVNYKENPYLMKSKLANLKDYYIDDDMVCAIFKKYDITLDDFNIKYNKLFKETLPPVLIKKLFNSAFLGLYELHFSKLIHCDIKPNNILIALTKYKNINDLFKDLTNKKLKKEDMHKFIDIKIIDFNKTQKLKSIYKSINIQTLYYTPPEVILGNREYNYSVDTWAMMNIIYELATSLFLFDVYNENIANGINYINYDDDDEFSVDSHKNDSDDSNDTNNSNSDNSDDYEDESMANLALLHTYHYTLGENHYIFGEEADKYYSYGKLVGLCNITFEKKQINIENNNIELKTILSELFDKIYIYNINDRISSEEIVRNYLF